MLGSLRLGRARILMTSFILLICFDKAAQATKQLLFSDLSNNNRAKHFFQGSTALSMQWLIVVA